MSPCFTVADIQGPDVRRVLNLAYVPALMLNASATFAPPDRSA
jgi:hypothetical protein